jgi:hypothetical protein
LDFAIEVALEHGGFVPRGRRAEDGKIPVLYHLTELSSISYAVWTKRNVREGDGTVVFSLDPILTGGSALTFEYATKVKKPRIHIHRSAADYSDEAFSQEAERLKEFYRVKPNCYTQCRRPARIEPARRLLVLAENASGVVPGS